MSRVWSRIKAHPLLSGGFLLALVVMLFFAVRLVVSGVYWADPVHRDQAIALWMTPGYVAHSWNIPREVMLTWIGPRPDGLGPETLAELAVRLGEDPQALITRLETEIAAYRAARAP